MTDTYGGPFGTYTTPAGPISTVAQANIVASINSLKALIPDPAVTTGVTSAPHPDFDQIPPHTAQKLRDELDALSTAIDAATT